jgi:hypothetical protein
MKRTLQEHLEWLQARQKNISAELMNAPTRESSNYLESELRTIRMAILHYESALQLELSLRKEESTGTK